MYARNFADANSYTSLEEQLASVDVLEMSPTFVRTNGVSRIGGTNL